MHGHTRKKLASRTRSLVVLGMLVCPGTILAQRLEVIPVEGQPLAANVERVVRALESLGAPLPAETVAAAGEAGRARAMPTALQRQLDPHVLLVVTINPEERVKVGRGPAAGGPPAGRLHAGPGQGDQRGRDDQGLCASPARSRARSSPGAADLSMARQDQRHLKEGEVPGRRPGPVPPGRDGHEPADDGEPRAAWGSSTPWP